MPQYALASHVFACQDGNYVVFLDLREDRYFALEAERTQGLDAHVHGWPASLVTHEAAAIAADERMLQILRARRLLTEGLADSKRSAAIVTGKAAREVFHDRYEDHVHHSAGTALGFIAATAMASFALRCWSLERVVRRVRKRNAAQRPSSQRHDLERIRELIAVFSDLRPYLFSWREACLFESLVLSEFLARHGVFPNWVFGVQARPFAAHCWLQQDEAVLNDTVERVSAFTPIMAV